LNKYTVTNRPKEQTHSWHRERDKRNILWLLGGATALALWATALPSIARPSEYKVPHNACRPVSQPWKGSTIYIIHFTEDITVRELGEDTAYPDIKTDRGRKEFLEFVTANCLHEQNPQFGLKKLLGPVKRIYPLIIPEGTYHYTWRYNLGNSEDRR